MFSTPVIPPRWKPEGTGIVWTVRPNDAPHLDHIETSGERCSLILTYGTGEGGALVQHPQVVWPTLRTLPNDTHASLRTDFGESYRPSLTVDGVSVHERLARARLDGLIVIDSQAGDLEVRRTWLTSGTLPVAIERISVRNRGRRTVRVALRAGEKRQTEEAKGVQGAYTLEARSWRGDERVLRAGATREMAVYYTAYPSSDSKPAFPDSPAKEVERRRRFVRALDGRLRLRTPAPAVDLMFRLAKARAAESLFRTKGGLVHSPGGGAYYAAIWANDQAEYANPLFGYLDYEPAHEAARTSFEWFARYVNSDYRPIPSSIIAEGESFWNGAGDRGDMAMIAYGAARYAAARGDRAEATRLWPLIEWCLEYLERKRSPEGIFLSDSDELEGRFPAGKANLNTSCLAYDALRSATTLANDLGHPDLAETYRQRADRLGPAIERYFGAKVEGFETYRYYAGNDVLRAWIATPLSVGLYDRAPGTLDALFSPRLWTDDGLASQAGDATFWDRATLYGFRGAFAAGATERALPRFLAYTRRRLLGEHVPYAVEAYPEGNQRHLSAESALYVRAVTEGLFGLRPIGLRRFEVNPQLPAAWKDSGLSLDDIAIAGTEASIRVKGDGYEVRLKGRGVRRYPLGKSVLIDVDAF